MIPDRLIDAFIKGFERSSPTVSYRETVANGLEAVFDHLTETNQDDNGCSQVLDAAVDYRTEALRNAVATMAATLQSVPEGHHIVSEEVEDHIIQLADRYREWLTT